jgi:WD40 repeat protein
MIVVTSQRNQYKIDLPEMKNKTAIQESDKFNVSLLTLKHPQSTSNLDQRVSPILIGQELKYIVAGDESGVVTIWKDSDQLEHNCGTLLRGHASKISAIKVTKHQDYLFTLGHDDHAIFEWKSRPSLTSRPYRGGLPREFIYEKNQRRFCRREC